MKTARALFIVGAPGAGKTTLVRRFFQHLDPFESRSLIPSPKWTVAEKICAAGHYNGGTFDGADTVPYNGVKAALAYWAKELVNPNRITIFDGDRFSHETAMDEIAEHALVHVLHLDATPEELAARRAQRGSTQNPAWMKGRETKARKFLELACQKGHGFNRGTADELGAAFDLP